MEAVIQVAYQQRCGPRGLEFPSSILENKLLWTWLQL